MPILTKLFSIATAGSAVASVSLLQRFLAGIAGVVILTIISTFLACTLIIGAFYLGYLGLIDNGLDPYAAGVIVAALMVLLTFAVILYTIFRLNRLQELPYTHMRDVPGLSRLTGVADAFLDGFLNPKN